MCRQRYPGAGGVSRAELPTILEEEEYSGQRNPSILEEEEYSGQRNPGLFY